VCFFFLEQSDASGSSHGKAKRARTSEDDPPPPVLYEENHEPGYSLLANALTSGASEAASPPQMQFSMPPISSDTNEPLEDIVGIFLLLPFYFDYFTKGSLNNFQIL